MSKVAHSKKPVTELVMAVGNFALSKLWRRPRPQSGFIYIAVLVALLMVSLASQSVMTYVSQQVQREREADLLRIGQTYVQAIGAYYEVTPGSVKRWPQTLEDLLEDRRLVTFRRHLREIYPDPITRMADWTLIRSMDGGIAGVRSRSELPPIRSSAMDLGNVKLEAASRYSDWLFVYQPPTVTKLP